mmetsp:Transcript_20555/g.45565  ORF Transcript_20555/g.45565 Transcript_20555/m.45565 type:complete len:991 (+) Transcript_20555:45-3017(+)
MDIHKRRLVRSLQVSAPQIKQRLPSRIVPRVVLERALGACGVGVIANAVLAGIVDRCTPAGSASTTTAVDTEILFKVVDRAAEQLEAEDVEFWESYFGNAEEVSWGALRAALLSRVLARASDLDARRSMTLLRRRLDPNNSGKVTRHHALEFFADVGGVEVVGMPEELVAAASPSRTVGESPARSPEADVDRGPGTDRSGSCSRDTSLVVPFDAESNTNSITIAALAARSQDRSSKGHPNRDCVPKGLTHQGPHFVRSDDSGPVSGLLRCGDGLSPGGISQGSRGDRTSACSGGRGLTSCSGPASSRPHCLARGPALMKLAALLARKLTCALRQSCQASFIAWRRSIVPRAPPRSREVATRRLPAKSRHGGDLPCHDSSTSTTASLPLRSERSSPGSVPVMEHRAASAQLHAHGNVGVLLHRGPSYGNAARPYAAPEVLCPAMPISGGPDCIALHGVGSQGVQQLGAVPLRGCESATRDQELLAATASAAGFGGAGIRVPGLSVRSIFRTLQCAARRRLGQSFGQLRRSSDAHTAQKAYIEHFDNGMFNVSKQAQAIVGLARVLLRASRRHYRILFGVAQADAFHRALAEEREASDIRARDDHHNWVAELNKRDAELQNIKAGVARRRRVQRQTQLAFAVARLSQVPRRVVRHAFNRMSAGTAASTVLPGAHDTVSAEVVRQSVAAALLAGTVSRVWQRNIFRIFAHLRVCSQKVSWFGNNASMMRRTQLALTQKSGPESARVFGSSQEFDLMACVASARTSRPTVDGGCDVASESCFAARSPPSQLFSSRLTFYDKKVAVLTKQGASAVARLRVPSQEARNEALRAWTGSGEESLLASSHDKVATQPSTVGSSGLLQKLVAAPLVETEECDSSRHFRCARTLQGHPPVPKAAAKSKQIRRKIDLNQAPQAGMQRAASTSCLLGSTCCEDKDSALLRSHGQRLGHSSSESVLTDRETPLLHARGGGLYGSNGVSLQSVDFYDPALWHVPS